MDDSSPIKTPVTINPSSTDQAACPSREALERYVSSQITDSPELQSLERHIAVCEGCSTVVYETFVAQATRDSRRSAFSIDPPRSPQLRAKIGPLRTLLGMLQPGSPERGGLILAALSLVCAVFLLHSLPELPVSSRLSPIQFGPRRSTPMIRLEPARPSIALLLEKADAIALSADPETARRTWSELRGPSLGTQFEGYVERQLERYEAIRAEAARRALADLRARWDDDWRFDFETKKALAALDRYERDFSGLLPAELESLRRYFLGLEAGPTEFRWRRRVLIRQGAWHTDSTVSVLANKGIEKDESWIRFTARGQSEVFVTFEIPDVPKQCHLRINAAQAISGRLREGRLKICVNDSVLFGGWRPWSYSWAVYEWPISSKLRPGRNKISLHLTQDSVNQVWLREISLLGYRERDAAPKETTR